MEIVDVHGPQPFEQPGLTAGIARNALQSLLKCSRTGVRSQYLHPGENRVERRPEFVEHRGP